MKNCARFEENIWAVDLAEMGLLTSKNLGVRHLLCVINIFSKHAWFKPLTSKPLTKTVLNDFIEESILSEELRAKNNKSYLGYLNNLLHEYNNT